MSIVVMGSGGGLNNTKLKLADADTTDVLKGKKFYSGDKELKTGTLELTGDAGAENVLSGKTFYNTDAKTQIVGTMHNNGFWPEADQFTLENNRIWMYKQSGFIGGGIGTSADVLGDASSGHVLSGVSASSKNGIKFTGTMRNNGRWPDADKFTLEGDKIYMYKQDGYTEGGLGSSASQLGNASSSHVLSGVSASSQNGIGFAGTMPNNGNWGTTLDPGGSATVPGGYHGGGGTVSARGVNNNDVIGKIKRASTTSRYVSNSSIYILGVENLAGSASYIEYQQFYLSEDHHTATWATAPGAVWTYLYLDM